MFSAKTYAARRNMLRTKIGSGIVLFPGNPLSPNNYPNNAYYFRQDSSFRYYFGLNTPSLAGLIDADTGEEALYGDDFTVEDIIWTGPQPTLRELGAKVGIAATHPLSELEKRLRKAISLGRKIHFLPPYRGETKLWLSSLLGIKPTLLHDYKSVDLMFAVAEMREKKSAEEVEEMERAFQIGYKMHTLAMKMCRPGVVERGDFDAGVLIHEGRFVYRERELELVADLGQLWEQRTALPLPLGGIAARRSLPDEVRHEAERLLRTSIEYAFTHPEASRTYIKQHAQELDDKVIDAHIALFVNGYSLSLGDEGRRAVEALTGVIP